VRSNPIVIDDNDDDGDEKLLQRPKAPSPKRVKIDSKSTKADSPRKRAEATKVDSPEKKTEATKMDSPKKRTKVTEVDSPKKKFSPKKLIEKGDNQAESPEKITVEIESKASPKKFNYREYLQRRSAGPAAPGSKPIPVGTPNCLLGLAFVFSGELDSLSREEAQDLVKRYGGRTTTAPSGRTSYVVLGREAGESKLKKIVELGLKTLDEDGLLELIRSSNPKGGHADAEARSSPSAIKETKQYSEEDIIQAKITKLVHKVPNVTVVKPETAKYEMWTDRYAPQTEDELIGNHSNYEKIVEWLQNWTPTVGEKAILISGPPGIGKTTAAHMACRQAGMDIVEMNASDTRSKSTLHDHVREIIDNRSLAGFDFFSKVSH
jgi:replication factor C subunit 1